MFKLVCYDDRGARIVFEETRNNQSDIISLLEENLKLDNGSHLNDRYSYRIFEQPEPEWIEREWRNAGVVLV